LTTDRPFIPIEGSLSRRSDARGHLDVLYEVGNLVLKRSFSRAGVFRGMHWQGPPHPQVKLIHLLRGRILDCVLDPLSPDPVLWAKELTPSSGWIRIDAHWAHGFHALEDTDFEYICHGAYREDAEVSLSIVTALRDHLGILEPQLSAKDAAATPFPVRTVRRVD
ncbi:MAG: dTDP-4-dehydrorhamnose 3,5-epimerase family protein, partial [Aquabacterium sp.]